MVRKYVRILTFRYTESIYIRYNNNYIYYYVLIAIYKYNNIAKNLNDLSKLISNGSLTVNHVLVMFVINFIHICFKFGISEFHQGYALRHILAESSLENETDKSIYIQGYW